MGCLCPKKSKKYANDEIKEKLNENDEEAPAPGSITLTNVEDLEKNNITVGFSKYNDLPKKRKLADYLIENDYNIFKRHLNEMRELGDEEFYELFEGNTKYNYSKENIKVLAQKFEDNKELTLQWYNEEKYYEFVLEIWKPNILQSLKKLGSEEEQNNLLKKKKIDTSKWDDNFRNYFEVIISTRPIKTLAERMKNYLLEDYGDFDELIKCVRVCKKNIKNSEKNTCNEILGVNLETAENKIISEIIPSFMNQLKEGFTNIESDFKKKEEEKAINQILNAGLSKNQEKHLIEEIQKIYEKDENKEEKNKKSENKEKKDDNEKEDNKEDDNEKEDKKEDDNEKEDDKKNKKKDEKKGKNIDYKAKVSSFFEFNGEYKKLVNLSKRFNGENSDKKIEFSKLSLKDKAGAIFSNKQIKHAILGISLANVSYSVLNLSKTIIDFKKYNFEYRQRLDKIKNNFSKHKKDVKIIDAIDENNIDEIIEQIIKSGKNFQEDLLEVQDLISDIQKTINDFKKHRDDQKKSLVENSINLITSIIGIIFTEGTNRAEYIASSAANASSIIGNSIDLVAGSEAIDEFSNYLKEAEKLENEINEEIDNLRQKYQEMSTRYFY